MQAIIPAGGEGLRLRPLSLNTPKSMIKIMDKPIIEYVTELLVKHKIKDIKITLKHIHRSAFGYMGNGEKWNAVLEYFYEDKPLGTVGGIKEAAKDCENNFILIYGDLITDFNLSEMIRFHNLHSPVMTVGKANGADAGIYVINKEALKFISDNLPFDTNDLIKKLKDNKRRVLVFSDNCSLYDIDTLKDYKSLNRAMLSDNKLIKYLNLSGNGKTNILKTKNVIIGANSHLEIGATINPPVYIGKNVYIEAGAEIGAFSVIGSNCKIYSNCRTENSVIMANSLISKDAVLKSTIISENTKVKSGAKICENTVIGENCIIGENSVVKPNVSIWPDKVTEDNKTVCENIMNTELNSSSIFMPDEISGEFGIEITVPVLCRLGLALSNLYKNSRFAVSTDESPASYMSKCAIISGIMEGGGEVFNLIPEPMPVFKEGVRFLSCRCGIYITFSGSKIKIILLDKYGLKIKREDMIKTASLFNLGEFFSAGVKNIKSVSAIQNLSEVYYKKYYPYNEELSSKRFFYYKSDLKKIESYVNKAAESLKITPVPLKDKKAVIGAVSVYFTDNGQNLFLYDENGKRLDDNAIFALKSELIYDSGIKKLIIPPDISINSVRTDVSYIKEKTYPSYYRRIIKEETELQEILTFDAVYFIFRLLKFLDKYSINLKDFNF